MQKSKKPPPIVIQDLRKSFGPQKVLAGLSLTIQDRETVAVLGRSGTGKSVLLKLVIGLQPPDSGEIQLFGSKIADLPRVELNQLRVKIGFLFQQAALYDSLSVEENVAFPRLRHTQLSDSQPRKRVRELLADVDMEKAMNKMPSEISDGMQK